MPVGRDDARRVLQAALAEHPEVTFAYLYGSILERHDYRDIDVAVYWQPTPPDLFEAETRLSAELTRGLRFPVDVHAINAAPTGAAHAMLRGEVLLVRDDRLLTKLIERVATEYMAFEHVRREDLRTASCRWSTSRSQPSSSAWPDSATCSRTATGPFGASWCSSTHESD